MRPVRMVGLVGAVLWTASCVSILGVDAEQYEDIDETICACVSGGDAVRGACEEIVQGLLERESAAEKANACVAESETCDALDGCLRDGAVCVALGDRCAAAPSGFSLQCCEGASCIDNECRFECEAPEITCGSSCCSATEICDEETQRCKSCSANGVEC